MVELVEQVIGALEGTRAAQVGVDHGGLDRVAGEITRPTGDLGIPEAVKSLGWLEGVHSPIPQVADRHTGALKAMDAAGLPANSLTWIVTSGLNIAEGRRAGERLLGIPRRRRPTGVFCANDLLALGLLQHLVQRGLDVPGDIAIVGYDDIEFAAGAAVPLTSVAQPRHLLGRTAAALLVDEANHPAGHQHQHVVFPPELIARASTAKTPR